MDPVEQGMAAKQARDEGPRQRLGIFRGTAAGQAGRVASRQGLVAAARIARTTLLKCLTRMMCVMQVAPVRLEHAVASRSGSSLEERGDTRRHTQPTGGGVVQGCIEAWHGATGLPMGNHFEVLVVTLNPDLPSTRGK